MSLRIKPNISGRQARFSDLPVFVSMRIVGDAVIIITDTVMSKQHLLIVFLEHRSLIAHPVPSSSSHSYLPR